MLARLWSLLRLLFVWRIHPKDSEGEPDCIIMLAFGQEMRRKAARPGLDEVKIVPGFANERIGRVVAFFDGYQAHCPHPPILAQWEFYDTDVGKRGFLRLELSLGSKDNYADTRQILHQADSYMALCRYKTATIVGHPWHLPRCIWIAERLGIEVIRNRRLESDLLKMANVWNQGVEVPDDQLQTTSVFHWILRELPARLYFWLKGWI